MWREPPQPSARLPASPDRVQGGPLGRHLRCPLGPAPRSPSLPEVSSPNGHTAPTVAQLRVVHLTLTHLTVAHLTLAHPEAATPGASLRRGRTAPDKGVAAVS